MAEHYKLVGRVAIETDMHGYLEWLTAIRDTSATHIRAGPRRVGLDDNVSTVFLGSDHSYGKKRMLFETLTYGNIYRYSTWKEARACHNAIVRYQEAGGKGLPEFLDKAFFDS